MQVLIVIFIAAVLISLAVQYWPLVLLGVVAWFLPRVVRHIRMKRYFSSDEFAGQKQEIAAVIDEHNEISEYVREIQVSGKYSIGKSSTGAHAHLATTTNTSKQNYKRDRNVANLGSKYVHNASLQLVRNASAEPIKYLMKYFDLAPSEVKLVEVEELGDSISKLENAIENLKKREAVISTEINPPKFILKYYLEEFQNQIGLEIPALEIPYPKYSFQYVSAGGNSSQETEIKLDSPTIDSLLEAMAEKIKFRASAAGQRSLMTAKFRNYIKQRDNYACKACSVSIVAEPNLLLEVDHITPVSKGGLSVETNLQTLCWRCNRSKSNKTPS